jgi:hypothetical protein
MSLDAFTISAISVVVLIAVILAVVTFMASRSQQARIEALEHSGNQTAAPPPPAQPETRAHREFCGAIHRLHPNARVGLDFQVKKEGGGLAIADWLLPTAPPSASELESAMAAYRQEQKAQSYRAAREAEYPSIGDQLDALYKARHGDADDLAALDTRIADVKARHPKPGQC